MGLSDEGWIEDLREQPPKPTPPALSPVTSAFHRSQSMAVLTRPASPLQYNRSGPISQALDDALLPGDLVFRIPV